jgi:predicted RNA-binding Zn-ribbon protein involved in translation (DUF1610 family)
MGEYSIIGKTATSFKCPKCGKKHGFKGKCLECFAKDGFF